MAHIALLLSLWLIPACTLVLALQLRPSRLWLITGIAFGAVVSPASMGLYELYFVGPLPALIGMFVGLPLMMLHSGPGYTIALWLGLIPPRTVVDGSQHFTLWVLDGLVWASVYGLIGWAVDSLRARRRARGATPSAV
jgi:hypothetical protein